MPKFAPAVRRMAPTVMRYGLAVCCVAASLLVTELLRHFTDGPPWSVFLAAVMISSWVAGLGPGLLAVVLSTLVVDYFFVPPLYILSLKIEYMPHLVVFGLSALLISWLSDRRRRAEAALRQARDELESRVQERTAELTRTNARLQAEIAERTRAEAALREQASLLDLTHDTVFVRDMGDVITYWNRGAEELYGWKQKEAIGQVSHQLMQTIFPTPLEAIHAELLGTGRWEGELIHTKRDGTPVVVASRWSLQRDEQGHPIVILETNNDITERRRAEEALRESEEQWRAVFENNPTMYFMVDATGTILSVNPFGAEQLGYTVDELVGRPVLNVFYDADREAVQRNVAACFEQLGRTMSWEVRKVRKDGAVLWVRETAKAMLIKNRPVVLIVCEDITERKRAEEALARTEQRLRAVIANAPIILFALDRAGVFTLSEGRGLNALGLEPGRVVGQSVFEVYRAAPQVLSAVRRALAGEPFTEVVDVNDLVFETYYIPFLDERGEVAGVNGVAINVTERKRAEEALRQAQAELAHVTRVLTLGELAASIAHEVNQPLAAVTTNGNAGLRWLARQPPNLEEARECLQRIIRDTNRASEVIARIRAPLRKAEPQKARLAINDVVAEVIALAEGEVRRNGVALHTDLAADLPPVLADRIQLQQVLLNLLLNGVEAMRAVTDRPRELIVQSQKEEADAIRIAVQDSGTGIDPQHLERIFTAFFTTKPAGLGMGLPISRSIIEAHGGRLWATPNVGPGVTMQFTLPTGDGGTP
jgi:PAS domain S-box-containing protein